MRKYMGKVALVASGFAIGAAASGFAAGDLNTVNADVDRFVTVLERVKSDYVEQVGDDKLMKGAINGMLAALDPHSSYLDARDFKQMQITTDGNYGGLGLSVTMEDSVVKVMTPMEDSPGYKAGIKSGDYITHLDGQLIYGLTLDEAVDRMRGKPGTAIRLTIVRAGRDKPFDVSITRQIVELKPVKVEVKDGIGIININSFSKQTGPMVEASFAQIDKMLGGKKPTGYVVDLRSNPGGLLDQAIEVSDAFLNRGEIVSQRGRYKRDTERFFARNGDLAGGLPVVVLIDSGSASAAEIVAGALQDHHRALVMGERSFGKGSVQTLMQLDEETALKLTTARYYTPSGKSVQEGGIDPDVDVPQLSDPDYKSRPKFREADLNRHLVNDAKVDNAALEADNKPDPRFAQTAEQLKAKGILDYQMHYALQSIGRLAKGQMAMTGGGKQKGSQ
jgi:carboxyl-terminal processing protease